MNRKTIVYSNKRRKKRRKTLLGTYILMVAAVLMFAVGLKLVIVHWSSPAPGLTVSSGSCEGDWRLMLVNRWNPVPEDYTVELTELWNGESVDSRIYPDLQEMFDSARAAGFNPYVNAGYRTNQVQQSLMDQEIQDNMAEGYSEKEARRLAEQWVAVPGTSEHEIGLAVDISMEDTVSQSRSEVWQWLMENSYKYGFILRYPEDKTDITGIGYEPWHYRYVGKEAAEEIYRKGICLEEYLDN